MNRKWRMLSITAAIILAVLLASDRTDAKFYENPVDCYALLVVAANDTNSTIHRNLDPIDVNGSLVGLSRIYGALIEAGFEDSKIVVLYCSGGLQPDWSEKKNAKYIKLLKKNHFNRPNMDANKANINSAVASVKEKLDENDQFVFWINTHGAANGTLMMAPRGQWGTGEIQQTFTGLKSSTNYILFDSCFSGQILDRCDIPNAVMFSTTGSNSPGWVDRNFTNCATYLESLNDKKHDKNKDGVVDCDEAFKVTHSYATEYEPKLKQYLKSNYRPPKPAPPGAIDRSSIIPKIEVGDSFERRQLGLPKGGGKAIAAKPARKRTARKKDPGEALMKKAKLYESGQDWVTVIDIYDKVANMGERSKHAKEARQKLDRLLAKPEVKAEYETARKQKQLEEDLLMAESYALAGRYDEVAKYCQKVIDAAPGSNEAKKAKILIDWAKEAERLAAPEEK